MSVALSPEPDAAVSGYLFCDFPGSHLSKFGIAIHLECREYDLVALSALLFKLCLCRILAYRGKGCQGLSDFGLLD